MNKQKLLPQGMYSLMRTYQYFKEPPIIGPWWAEWVGGEVQFSSLKFNQH